MNRVDVVLSAAQEFVIRFLSQLDGVHPVMIAPVVVLVVVIAGAAAAAVAIVAAAAVALIATAGVAVLAQRLILSAVRYSHRRSLKGA